MGFDLEKAMANGGRCRTRDGRAVRILCEDAISRLDDTLDLITLVTQAFGGETVLRIARDGRYLNDREHGNDLVNLPERYERWVNVYGWKGCGNVRFSVPHPSREAADMSALEGRVACIPVEFEFEEGEGL